MLNQKFTNVDEIRAALGTQNNDALIQNLTVLRNQLAIKPGEKVISPQDERLVLAQHWLERIPGARDVFEIWDGVAQARGVLTLLVAVLSSLLALLSSHYPFHALGQPIIKTLLTPTYMRRLNSYLGGSHHELILVTLKLFNAMSAFAGGREKKAVLESFGWELKSLPKLLNMRRKHDTADPLSRPDIRTLYILFLLSFLDADSSTHVKTSFLDQHRDPFLAAFKGLVHDPYPVVRRILEVCWTDIWMDPKIKRTIKIGLFSEATIAHMVKLYERSAPEHDEQGHIPADLVHHFLLATCTRPGTGICFKDRGWYPRETDEERRRDHDADEEREEDDGRKKHKGRIYNKILANIVKTLKVNEDLRQQELAMKILAACPELVSGYWSGAALTLEPRLSSKWIANIAFFGAVISLPVPESCFVLPSLSLSSTSTTSTKINTNMALYNPTPPLLSTTLDNIFPSASTINTKAHLSKGLQSPSALVRHCTALALARCLSKYERVIEAFRRVEEALGDDIEDKGEDVDLYGDGQGGTWARRRREVEREVRRRVPEWQVVVAFSQAHRGGEASIPAAGGRDDEGEGAKAKPKTKVEIKMNRTGEALLAESAQRVVGLYQRCLSGVVGEARFDVGKLLSGFEVSRRLGEGDDDDAARRLGVVRQLHVLRLLKDNEQFTLFGKATNTSQTHLSTLLRAYLCSPTPAIRTALSALLEHLIARSVLFEHDPGEAGAWLAALLLPGARRGRGTEAPDGAGLGDEGEAVVRFVEECVGRAGKGVYRYLEEMEGVGGSGNGVMVSPLMMTVLEQLEIKVGKRLLGPSDVLALAAFVRKLAFRLVSRCVSGGVKGVMRKVWERVDGAVLARERLWEGEFPIMTDAVRREVRVMGWCVGAGRREEVEVERMSVNGDGGGEVPLVLQAVTAFLSAVEAMPVPENDEKRATTATELIDWLRLLNANLGVGELRRVTDIVEALWMPSIANLVQHVDPACGCLWEGMDVVQRFEKLGPYLEFDFMFMHATEEQFRDERCRDILVDMALQPPSSSSSLVQVKTAVGMIDQRIRDSWGREEGVRGLFLLLAAVLKKAEGSGDYMALKEMVFGRLPAVREYLTSESVSDVVRDGLHYLVRSSLDSTNPSDLGLLSDTTTFWFDALRSHLPDAPMPVPLVSIWISFFQSREVLDLLDTLMGSDIGRLPTTGTLHLLRELLGAVHRLTASDLDADVALKERLPRLLALRRVTLLQSDVLDELIALGVEACCPGAPVHIEAVEGVGPLVPVLRRAETRWSRRLVPLSSSELPVEEFLMQDVWSALTVRIVSGLVYQRAASRRAVLEWLKTKDAARRPDEHYVRIVCAFLDVCATEGVELPLEEWLLTHFLRLVNVVCEVRNSGETSSVAGVCVSLLMRVVPSAALRLVGICLDAVKGLHMMALPRDLLLVASRLPGGVLSAEGKALIAALIDHGVQWAIRRFGDDMDEQDHSTIEVLTSLVQLAAGIKPHHVETLVGVVVQNRLSNVVALGLVTALLSAVQLKPVVVNRLLQSIIQHSHFLELCANSTSEGPGTRDAIVSLLHVMFHLHPANTCQITHVKPLVQIYRGTLSPADGQLLSIFQLFEAERKVSIASLLGRWSSASNVVSSTPLEAVQGLDPILVLRTCLKFPRWRTLGELSTEKATRHEAQLYDPVFLTLLLAQTLAEDPPVSAFAWVEIFRTNIVSLVIKALSSKDGGIREVALSQLAVLWQCLQTADLQEKPHVLHILSLLKDVLPPPSSHEAPKRLPSYTTLLLLHALRGIFYPSNFIYPITARFLLQRPELDTKDVPMLYGMLYSSSDDWKKERGWIIRFLSDGMMSSEDWRVLKGRYTWDLLASMFQSSQEDRPLRAGILEVLANLTCNSQATTSLVVKSGLLAWIEIQLTTVTTVVEGMEWVKILCNVMTIVNAEKIETATGGAWRAAICRCLAMSLDSPKTQNAAAVFPFAALAILRLSLLPGTPIRGFDILLKNALDCLMRMETSLSIPSASSKVSPLGDLSTLYGAHEVHDLFPAGDPLGIWGSCVEALWRATMTLNKKSEAWDVLSSRMLVWRALSDGSVLGEWVWTQAIGNIHVLQ